MWLVLWVGWNAFIICFYLEVGHLSQVTTGFHSTARHCCLLAFLSLSSLNPSFAFLPFLSLLSLSIPRCHSGKEPRPALAVATMTRASKCSSLG